MTFSYSLLVTEVLGKYKLLKFLYFILNWGCSVQRFGL